MSVVGAALYLKDATVGAGNLFVDTVVRVCLSCCTVVALIWMAILMYISFYYAYMPTVHHTQPVFLRFLSECGSKPRDGLCSFPEANVTLSKGERILMRGQKYQVFLDLDMPYSPVNENLGMFMISVKFLSNSGKAVATSLRSCMLHFKSGPLKLMHTLFMSVPLLLGFTEEKQKVAVNLFENYVDDSYHPVTSVNIVVMAKHVEIYRAVLRIEAQFSGFRFILFNWPLSSALICISGNFIVICIIFFFAYNAFTPEPTEIIDEMEVEVDVQERLYGEARRRDLGRAERRVPRSPIRVISPASTQHNGRSRIKTIHTRNRVSNFHASSTHLVPPFHNTPRRRLRSASFPPCRWESCDCQSAPGSNMGEAVRGTPCTPRGDSTPVHFGVQVDSTQGYSLCDDTGVEDIRDWKSRSEMGSRQPSKPYTVMESEKSKLKNKNASDTNDIMFNNKQRTKTVAMTNGCYKTNADGFSTTDGPQQRFSPLYTIIEPKSGMQFNSYSDFKIKKTNTLKEMENQPIGEKEPNINVPIYSNGTIDPPPLNTSNAKSNEHSTVLEDERKPVIKRRSTSKTRAKFGLSFKKMLPRR